VLKYFFEHAVDLLRVREAFALCADKVTLGKEYLLSPFYLKDTAAALNEGYYSMRICCRNLFFHTGSFWQIVSLTTVDNRDMHLFSFCLSNRWVFRATLI